MGQNIKVVAKRRRRKEYLKRKKVEVLTKTSAPRGRKPAKKASTESAAA